VRSPSGLRLAAIQPLDAEQKSECGGVGSRVSDCQAGLVLRGLLKPHECRLGKQCTPSARSARRCIVRRRVRAYYQYGKS